MAPSSTAVGRGVLVAGIALSLLGTGVVAGSADEEPAGPIVVTEAVDDRDVRASLRFPVGWRSEAPRGELTPRFVNAVGVDERCELPTRRSDFGDLVTDVDALFCVGEPTPDDRYRSLAASLEWLPAE